MAHYTEGELRAKRDDTLKPSGLKVVKMKLLVVHDEGKDENGDDFSKESFEYVTFYNSKNSGKVYTAKDLPPIRSNVRVKCTHKVWEKSDGEDIKSGINYQVWNPDHITVI